MYINLYAIITGLIGTLFIVTKMRHPHIKHVRESLEGSVLFKAINALDFYTGNHALFYNELFPELPSNYTPSKDPFRFPVPSICSCTLPSPYVDHSYFRQEKSPGAAYQILPALCATAGVFLFSVAIYLRKSLRLALRDNQRNVVIHATQVERRASQEPNTVLPASNANVSQGALVPSPSVSVVTRRDDPVFYPKADTVVVAPPIPVALSDPLFRTNSLPSEFFQSRAIQSSPAAPLAAESPPPPSPSIVLSATEPLDAQIDDDLPYLIPLPQDEPGPVTAEESPGVSIETPSLLVVESDVTAISYFTSLPFAQDLGAQRSATLTPAPVSSPGSRSRSPRNPLHVAEPATRPVSTPQVSCRRPDWLTSAQYWEAHTRLNALVSNTAAGIETTTDATRIEAPIISPPDVLDSPSPYKISVPRVRATTSLAQPTTVSGSASHWEHPAASTSALVEAPFEPFITGRTGADLVLAMSTSMPRVIDLGIMSGGGSQGNNSISMSDGDRGEWVGASGSISTLAEMSISPRASSILRQVAAAATAVDTAQASPPGSSRRRPRAVTAAVLQTLWLNRTGAHDSGAGVLPGTVTATRSTGVSPVQTAVQTSAKRRVLGARYGTADRPSERWVAPADSAERPPVRITRIFGEPAA